MTVVHVENLRVAYPASLPQTPQIDALEGVDLRVAQGECVALLGRVGAGKSTLCLALTGAVPQAIDCAMDGRVVVSGQDTRATPMAELSLTVGLVPENAAAYLFNATVADEVAFGLESLGLPADEIERRIDETLASVGLDGFRARTPQTLSGGEQKRLALACVLAMRPAVLVLDEPMTGLDPRGRRQVIEIIDRLRREQGATILIATQDAEAVAQLADRAVVLQDGYVAFDGPVDALLAQPDALAAWGLHAPQLAELAFELTRRSGQVFTFYQLADAERALTGFVETPPPTAGDATHRLRHPPPFYGGGQGGGKSSQICLENVSYRYPGADHAALRGIDLQIAPGDWLAVIGINGSGKSTLIRHLNGLLKPTGGAVWVDGQDARRRSVGELARVVSYLPQNPDRQIFAARVYDEVAYGPHQLGLRGQALDERVHSTLALLDLTAYVDHPPAVLSYALRRRVALAATLAMDAPALALDEPDVGLDRRSAEQMMEIIAQRHGRGTTVIMITHDLRLVARYAGHVIVLYEGEIAVQGTPVDVLADVDTLHRVGLDELPVTALAGRLHLNPPLPLSASELARQLVGPPSTGAPSAGAPSAGAEEAVDG
ncbi:MAG: ABC transporter ATP-binding protein [Anaerolineae bacterium]|nr:ABC transporter ATP-binding protein [Anaerolineae bacterium]